MTTHPFPLGRRLEPNHDPKSRNFAAPAATVTTKSWQHYGGVLDQGQLGSCTGNAMAQALNTKPLHRAYSAYLTEADAVALYSLATTLDPFPGAYPPEDTGSDGLSVAKAARQQGRIGSYVHGFGLQHTLEALMAGPVLLGTPWYEGMFNPTTQGFVTISGRVAGGHEYLLLGVNAYQKYVTCLNSWGNGWGLRGMFRMTYATLSRLLSEDGDATQPVR